MNKEKIKRKLITILFVCIGMLCFGLLAGVKADNRVQMRTTINNESPLLLSRCMAMIMVTDYGGGTH